MSAYIPIWICAAVALILVMTHAKAKYGWQRVLRVSAVILVVAGLSGSTLDAAQAEVPRAVPHVLPHENHDVQCIAGGLGVAGAWMGTLGSAPTTAGLVTAGAAAASTGATVAWADACPEYARTIANFLNPASIAVWEVRTVGRWILGGSSYQRTGRFCVRRPYQSTKRCFLWKNLGPDQMHRAMRNWLSTYDISYRLYVGQLVMA